MHGIISFLPQPFYDQVLAIWKELQANHGLVGIQVTPYPHFSWQIAEAYELERLQEILQQVAAETAPFTVTTAGLGVFTGPRPVIFIRVVKSPALSALHQRLWERVLPAAQGASPYYAPDSWMPHISLAYEDIDPENIHPVIEDLAFRSYHWEIPVNNLSLIYEPTGEVGVLMFHFPFDGK